LKPIHVEEFWHEGRGPELVRLHWHPSGTILQAADYHNPDWGSTTPLRRVRFARAQVAMITPEEVIDYATLGPLLAAHRPAAMFDLGRSPWLESFAPRHRARCRHFRLMFYDQRLDVIAEGVDVGLAESMPLATGTMRLGAAGNVEAPAWLELLARGYRVQTGARRWIATGPLGRFMGDGPLDLLGLVALAESRGSRWQASDAEIEAFLRATSLEEERE
jgi:hypothetical protein